MSDNGNAQDVLLGCGEGKIVVTLHTENIIFRDCRLTIEQWLWRMFG